jgi:DNA repair protein RecO (recombination protein O)
MQTRISDQSAFILHRRDYKESSLILEIFSEQFGRVSVLAQSARKRRDASHFQICNRLLIGWTGRSELKTLTQIESRMLTVPAEFYPSVFYVNELLMILLPKHQPHSALFQQYQNLLLTLAQHDTDSRALAAALRNFEIGLLTELGLMPDLSQHSHNAHSLDADGWYFIDNTGGVTAAFDNTTANYQGRTLLAIQQRRFDEPEIARAARILLRQLIDYNLQGRTLQSRKFYQQLQK